MNREDIAASVSRQSIATGIAKSWGLAGSTNLVQWGLLAVLIALLLGIAGGWWVGDSLQQGKQAKAENKQLTRTLAEADRYIQRQQGVIASSSAEMSTAIERIRTIAEDTASDREQTRREFVTIRSQTNDALAARPDLRDVRVGPGVLDAWNAANRGRASGSAGTAQPAAGLQPGAAAGQSGKPAAGKAR